MRSDAPSPLWLRLLGWLPLGATLVAISIFAVEVPTQDDWDMPGALFEQWLRGQARWADFFAQQNESRFVLPRLIMLGSSVLAGGFRTIPWMFVSCGFMCLTLLALRRWGWNTREQGGAWLACFGALLYCLPTQTENLTWGGQMGLFVPGLAIVLCHGVVRQVASPWMRYGLCALLAFAGTFSFANGMVVWVLGCPLWAAWLRRESLRPIGPPVAYALVFFVTLAWYFHDYIKPAHHPSMLTGLGKPWTLLVYFLTWLGGPFFMALNRPLLLAPLLGLATLTLAAWSLQLAWRRRHDLPVSAHLWLMLLAYGLACGAVTSLGRCAMGQDTALASRYTTFALWVPLASVGLAHCLRVENVRAPIAGLCLLLLLAWPSGWYALRNRAEALEQDRLSLQMINLLPENPLLLRLYPSIEPILRRSRVYVEHGWLPKPAEAEWLREAIQNPAAEQGGWIDSLPGPGGGNLMGWAMNPRSKQAADFVVIAQRDAAGKWVPWTAIRAARQRKDVARSMKAPGLERSGFECRLPSWPKGEWQAFAVDAQGRAAYPLKQTGS